MYLKIGLTVALTNKIQIAGIFSKFQILDLVSDIRYLFVPHCGYIHRIWIQTTRQNFGSVTKRGKNKR